MKVDHVPERSVRERWTEHGDIVLQYKSREAQQGQWGGLDTQRSIHFVRPVIYGFLVVYLFPEPTNERAWRPYLARRFLLGEHRIKDRREPVFELAVIIIGNN